MNRHCKVRLGLALYLPIISLVSLFLALTIKTPAQDSQVTSPASQTNSGHAAPTPAIPPYPNTPQGLESLMKEMLKLSKGSDHAALARYAKSLELPDAESWFTSVFGDKLGPQMTTASERARLEIAISAPDFLTRARTEKLSEVQAVRFDEECNRLATDSEFPLLMRRVRFDPLYDVRFHDSKKMLIWAYFAYVDGGFRYIGTLALTATGSEYARGKNPPPSPVSADQTKPQRIHVGGQLQQAQLLPSCQVVPVYPQDAKDSHISGTVILHAVIGTDGEVHDLEPISGPPMLIQSAMNAVKRWRYRPMLLKGEPVEVDTTISVVFTLG